MTPKQAVAELQSLLADLETRGGKMPSPELRAFLETLSKRNARNARLSSANESSGSKGVARKRRRPDPQTMAKTVEQLVAKLNAAFMSDASFEKVVQEAASSDLTKENVVKLYNELFATERKFPKSATKPDLFNAIRRDRIARVRARS